MPSRTREERSIAEAAAQLTAVGQTIEVLAFTPDASLLATLRDSVGNQPHIRHAMSREEAVEIIMAGRVGVIVLDVLATPDDSAEFCERLRTQFPDLVLMVAGGTDEQTHLVKQVTAGDIYRFLHKPVSPARARQFLEAAIRRHLEGRTFTPAETAPATRNPRTLLYVALAVGAALLLAIAAFLFLRRDSPDAAVRLRQAATTSSPVELPSPAATGSAEHIPDAASPPPTASPTVAEAPSAIAAAPEDPAGALLLRAREALAASQFVTPMGSSAADLFSQVLALDSGNREAQQGLDRIADQLLSDAETALLEERIDDASRHIDAARGVRPNNVRLAFLQAQLVKERERSLIALARQAAASGKHERARTLLSRAVQGQPAPSPVLLEARKELDQRRLGDGVTALLQRANERLKQDRLVEPAGDSARTYIEAALAADAGNVPALQAKRALNDQLLSRGRRAISQGDFAAAEQWLSHAEALGAERSSLRSAQRELKTVRETATRAAEIARLSALMQERIGENRLLDPPRDNARHYWQALHTIDPSNTRLQPAARAIGAGLVREARESVARNELDDAQHALDEAQGLGYTEEDFVVLEREVAAGRQREAFLADVVPATQLATDRMVSPRYPSAAERNGIEGWVDVEFTIATDGSVKDILVRGSSPARVFDDAATRAVAQWKYRPLLRNGRPGEQRARLRVVFDLTD